MAQKNSGKYSTLSKNVLLFTISSFGSKIIQFLLVPLYTSVLSTGDYGTVDLMNTTSQLLIPVLTLNMQDAVLRFCLDKKYKKNDVMAVSLRVNLIAGLGLGTVLLLLHSNSRYCKTGFNLFGIPFVSLFFSELYSIACRCI